MVLISAHIFHSFWKLQSFRKWDNGIDIDPEDETFYMTQYLEALLQYAENEICAKHRRLTVMKPESVANNNLIFSAIASRSGQSSDDPSDLSSDDEVYLIGKDEAKTTHGQCDRAVRIWTAARLYLNSTTELPQN